jgi:putative membrane protein
MQKKLMVFLSVLSVITLLSFGCKKEESTTTDTSATTDTSSTTSTAVAGTLDTSGTSGTTATTTASTDTTATAGSGTMASNPTPLSKDDSEFIMKAAQGGMAEVNLGTMAAQSAASADVKSFGNQMVTDHGKANDELKQLAASKGVTLPADVGKENQEVADKLGKLTGAKFDKAYMHDMVEDHEKDVKEFEKASKGAKDPDLKAWAAKTLPTLEGHLKMAKDTDKKVK